MKTKFQMSETISLGIILAICGGYMDAYSYLCRDQVFANAQTGNLVLLAVSLVEHDIMTALHYMWPVVFFVIGILLSDMIQHSFKTNGSIHWRQLTVLIEAIVLLLVAFIPLQYNWLANSITSLACGIQVESFRKIHGNGIATTMCIGNLRSGTNHLHQYITTKDKSNLHKSLLYFGIIVIFMAGALLGSIIINHLHTKSIILCSVALLVTFLMMFRSKT